jgi:hypothetical protein
MAVTVVGAVPPSPWPKTFTGCLKPDGNIHFVAEGSAPKKPCPTTEKQMTISGGDITAVLTASDSGLTGGTEYGDVSLALGDSYKLPQTCTEGQQPSWDDTNDTWVCATAAGGSPVAAVGDGGGFTGEPTSTAPLDSTVITTAHIGDLLVNGKNVDAALDCSVSDDQCIGTWALYVDGVGVPNGGYVLAAAAHTYVTHTIVLYGIVTGLAPGPHSVSIIAQTSSNDAYVAGADAQVEAIALAG